MLQLMATALGFQVEKCKKQSEQGISTQLAFIMLSSYQSALQQFIYFKHHLTWSKTTLLTYPVNHYEFLFSLLHCEASHSIPNLLNLQQTLLKNMGEQWTSQA